MAQQTAVEWLVEQYANENYGIEVYEQAKQMEREKHGLFLHWFVKHYETATIDGMFGFVDATSKEVTVKEIVDHYYNETYGK